MRYGLLSAAVGVGLIVGGFGRVAGGGAPGATDAKWLSDYAAAREAARAGGKPIFAVFH